VIPGHQASGRLGHDVMSYCAWQWLSNYTYANMRQRLLAEAAAGAAVAGPAPGAPSAAPRTRSAETSAFLHVVVRIDEGWQSSRLISLTPTDRLATSGAIPVPADPPTIEPLSANGAVLASIPVAVQPFTDGERDEHRPRAEGLINTAVPVNGNVVGLRVLYAGKILVERRADPNKPSVAPHAAARVRRVAPNAAPPLLLAQPLPPRWQGPPSG